MDKKQDDKKAKNQFKPEATQSDDDFYPDISNTVSSSECTGLMFSPPQNSDELENYQELSDMQIPKQKKDKKN